MEGDNCCYKSKNFKKYFL